MVTDADLSVLNRITELFRSQSATELVKNSLTAAHRQFFEREDDGAQAAVRTSREVIGQDDPYFLFVNFLEPHLPYEPPEHLQREFMPDSISDQDIDEVNQDGRAYNVRNVEMSDRDFDILERLYDAEIRYVDDRIQEILNKIESSDQDTIVIIMGDHGENIGDHGLMTHNYSIHDTLLHVPLIIQSPEIFEDGETVHERISSLDIPTTVMDILSEFGISDDEFKRQQSGISLRNVPEESIDRHVVSEYLNPIPPIEKMESLCENPDFDVSIYDRTLRATYSGDFKLIRGSDGTKDLYDVSGGAEKIEENGAAKRDMVKGLETQLSTWIDRHERQDQSEVQSDHEEEIEERLGELGYL
jgi:arylsulfatase A-like enzyme